jgi:hypothetical protein
MGIKSVPSHNQIYKSLEASFKAIGTTLLAQKRESGFLVMVIFSVLYLMVE